jgi:hypothetical protein
MIAIPNSHVDGLGQRGRTAIASSQAGGDKPANGYNAST